MNIKTYLIESEKTLSRKFYYDIDENEVTLRRAMEKFIKAGQELDLVKKSKFYGKDINFSYKDLGDGKAPKFKRDNIGEEHILHASIGIATEATELMEAIYAHKFEGKELDRVNVREEIIDNFWYIAILLRDLDIDFHDALQINIDKLRARYGEKFSSDKANNRDLDSEREILEK